ncbi:MAG: hypothetical protein ACE5EO_00855 [Candidatus Krumholzibacteriia bacterium]
MFKGKLAVLCLLAASLLMIHGIAFAGIIDPCVSNCTLIATGGASGPPFPLFVCPQGDTDTFDDQVGGLASGIGFIISVTVLESNSTPIPNIPGADFWLVDCDPLNDAVLCGGSASSGADSLTNASGTTTMGGLGGLTGGGCADGVSVVVQGFALQDPLVSCTAAKCLGVNVRSPDIDGTNEVNLVDLSLFAAAFPPQPFDTCADFDINGLVNLQDLSRFAFHFGPPGHKCN